MTRARRHLVCVDDTPYYHVTARCVRRAFLCGEDRLTGRSYEHRRGWIEKRVRTLSSIFAIDLCAYAIMSNHYHLVVRLNPSAAESWSDEAVLKRWTSLFSGPILVQRYLAGAQLSSAETNAVRSSVSVFRQRLACLSWFMKCLNEPIAREANAEDECTGHFWEGRFHSQALKTDRALLTAMAYVDLNPIRAGIAKTPEESDYTSIKAHLNDHTGLSAGGSTGQPLVPFDDSTSQEKRDGARLPIQRREYLKLVDATGRLLASGKHGRIDPGLDPILDRLGLRDEVWLMCVSDFRGNFRNGDLRVNRAA
jgi:REP element-mobilizing transposase RayT